MVSDSPAQAAEAIRLVQARPQVARRLALTAFDVATSAGDMATASMAKRALGLVAKERNDMDAAEAQMREAVRLAEQAGSRTRTGEARMSLSLILAHRGRGAAALREADRAGDLLRGHDRARVQMQRALVLQHMGRFGDALEGYRRALGGFRRSGDGLWEARVRCNRGVLHAYRGEYRAAESDLLQAERICEELELELLLGMVRHNLGFVYALRGDVPLALRWYDRAEESHGIDGVHRAEALLDRAELLLSVRLVREARAAAEQAVEDFARGRMAARLAEARLTLSQAALLDGDYPTARAAAEQARRAFSRQGRPRWVALARYASLQATWCSGERAPSTLAAARRTAAALGATGWAVRSLDASVVAARIALDLGRVDVAERELRVASRARHHGPVELRSRAWHARELLCLARNDRRGGEAALRAGLDVLERYRAVLGATELRASTSGHGADLALDGLRLAVAAGQAGKVLEWAERWRARALAVRPARPPDDAALTGDLAKLRQVIREVERAVLSGGSPTALRREQAAAEEAVRRRARAAAGGGVRAEPIPSPAALVAALSGRALVEIVELDGWCHTVVLSDRGLQLVAAGPVAPILDELGSLRFALRRLARPGRPSPSTDAAATAAAYAAKRLDQLILEPCAAAAGDRPLVVVPTGSLHAIPWALLPSCHDRPVTVAPSATLWLRSASATHGGPLRRATLVSGPGTDHAEAEVRSVSPRAEHVELLVGAEASVANVLRAIDGAGLAHIAAHGTFRADNPLFSCIHLADGPLTVYDLECLGHAPEVLVLSACESGLSDVQPGNELMGLASVLLALGTRTLVASTGPVPDAQTAAVMVAFHRRLADGRPPAESLAGALAELDPSEPSSAAAAGFVCFGAG
jgi:tetratricopeptide (TPR) repeat protein